MRAGIALGSNLGDRLAHLRAGWSAIQRLPGVGLPALCSPIYETEPVACEADSGAYLNAVVEIGWPSSPEALLSHLQHIELAQGRPAARAKNLSRTLDLDLLYVGEEVRATSQLLLPHPRITARRFVLTPLAEIRPHLRLPGQPMTVARLLETLHDPAAVEVWPEPLQP